MSQTYFTSDPHFGHENVATIHRGFSSTLEMDHHIIQTWSTQLAKNPKPERDPDTIFILGDLALGKHERALFLLSNLPGVKHLITGNHDPVHPMHRHYRKHLSQYLEVFETVQPFGTYRFANRRSVLLSHFPYLTHDGHADHSTPPRHPQWRLPDTGSWLIHGHTHMKNQVFHPSRQLHVGVDAWDYKMATQTQLENIIEMMENDPLQFPPRFPPVPPALEI